MKELSIEQKAKAYDEAISLIKDYNRDEEGFICVKPENIFPELKESKDEKIRNQIINFIEEYGNPIHCEWQKDWIAWLEKQGEQPRYSIGDVLCDKSCTTLNKDAQSNFEITDIRNGMYICDKCSFPISQQDEYELVAKKVEQKSAEWSEEDERIFGSFLHKLEVCDLLSNKEIRWAKRRLKSLKPQSHWKPTEEQLYMLNWLATNVLDDGVTGKPAKEVLYSLYEQLKQL